MSSPSGGGPVVRRPRQVGWYRPIGDRRIGARAWVVRVVVDAVDTGGPGAASGSSGGSVCLVVRGASPQRCPP
jgi:hypothetical protein